MKKYLKPTLVLILVVALAIGGTLAYLTDSTGDLANKFTVDKEVDIELNETKNDFEIVPGKDHLKDPTITVIKDDCYVFVEVVETIPTKALGENGSQYQFSDYVSYEVETGSEQGETTNGQKWYWTKVPVNITDADDNKVTVDSITATGTYENSAVEYTTVTYVYAVTDASGKLLVLSSKDTDDFKVLKDDKASIPETVTQEMMTLVPYKDAQELEKYSIDLTFSGYAIQTAVISEDDSLTIGDIYDLAHAGTTSKDKGITTTPGKQ